MHVHMLALHVFCLVPSAQHASTMISVFVRFLWKGHHIMLYHSPLARPNTQIGMNHTARPAGPTQHANRHEHMAWPVGRLSSSGNSLAMALMDDIAK